MEFLVEEYDVIQLIFGYLKERGAYESLSSLQLESGLSIGKLGGELLYAQKLVLQGRWDEAAMFLKPVKEKHDLTSQIDFLIGRQKFLESLSYQGSGGQRFAFPPWKPDSNLITSSSGKGGGDSGFSDVVEKEVIFGQLIALQSICSTEVITNTLI
jgi:hypothetical protein